MIRANELRFKLSGPVSQDRVTTRRLQIEIDDEPVWPAPGITDADLEIQIDDLLAFLAENWKPLLLRQTYPVGLNPPRPSQLRMQAQNRWDDFPQEIAEEEECFVSSFEDSHDLSRSFAGFFDLNSFWILREGEKYIIDNQTDTWFIPYSSVVKELIHIGDQVAEILRNAGDKWEPLLAQWCNRWDGDGVRLLAWATGIGIEDSKTLIHEGLLAEPKSFAEAANDNDELRIAARLAGALPVEQIREILLIARDYPKTDAPELKRLANVCLKEIDSARWAGKRWYVQGEATARTVRTWLGYGPNMPIDLAAVFRRLSINLHAADVDPETLDGLAIWGSNHGPGVFLNLASRRVGSAEASDPNDDPALRVTLAHELCHLLLDGTHAVSAVDVLKSRMPVGIEQRAKSFAGELLLPSRTAAAQWQDMGQPFDREGVRHVLARLEADFRVPRAVSTWKLDHGLRFRHIDLSSLLGSMSKYR